jgi:dethiobiotin synthetase
MGKAVLITGTDTGIGKTWVTGGLAGVMARKAADLSVRVWKPVQTGVEADDPQADSNLAVRIGGLQQAGEHAASITLPDPLAPWVAAGRVGVTIDMESLIEEGRRRIEASDLLLVEGAGGLAVPLTGDALIADLAVELRLPIIIVARPGLGTVNHTVLTVAFARLKGLEVKGVILNGCEDAKDPALQENVMMIERFSGAKVIGTLPKHLCHAENDAEWVNWREQWLDIVNANVETDYIFS